MSPEAETSARETMVDLVGDLEVLSHEMDQLSPFVEQSKICKQIKIERPEKRHQQKEKESQS
jgi:hypothetical protein